jgi:hypothetical protein
MSMTPRSAQWLQMSADARANADGMRDHEGKWIINGYEELATWAAKAEMVDTDGLDWLKSVSVPRAPDRLLRVVGGWALSLTLPPSSIVSAIAVA